MCVNLERKMLHLWIPLCHASCHDTPRVLRSKAPPIYHRMCACVCTAGLKGREEESANGSGKSGAGEMHHDASHSLQGKQLASLKI